jgi:hypothetical protein
MSLFLKESSYLNKPYLKKPKLRRMNAGFINMYDLNHKTNDDLKFITEHIINNSCKKTNPGYFIMSQGFKSGHYGLITDKYEDWREYWVSLNNVNNHYYRY